MNRFPQNRYYDQWKSFAVSQRNFDYISILQGEIAITLVIVSLSTKACHIARQSIILRFKACVVLQNAYPKLRS